MSGAIAIILENVQGAFLPGHPIVGAVEWSLPEAPPIVQVRLVWSTAGKGTRDSAVVRELALSPCQRIDRQTFELTAPEGPYSFSGKVVSLIWAIEAAASSEIKTRREIVISPSAAEIQLHAPVQPVLT